MALPLPHLTFEQTALFVASSSSTEDVLIAIEAAFASLSVNQWTTARAKGEATPNFAIRITAPSSSPVSNFNAILGSPAGPGGFTRADIKDHTIASGSYDNAYGGELWLSIGPDGYDDATAPADWVTGTSSYGTGKRESGFWSATYESGGVSAITKVWVVASEETCAICFRYGSDSACGFMYFGAIVEGVDADNVESDDRLYGMSVPGAGASIPMDASWLYNAGISKNTSLTHQGATADKSHFGVFDPTSAGAAGWSTCTRQGNGNWTTYRPLGTSAFNGGLALVPMLAWRVLNTSVDGMCGRIRGIYYTEYGTARSVLLDSGAAAKGYRMSGALAATTYDACVFANEG